jgi:uridine kinase
LSSCVIAIAGPSGSGKSLFAETLCAEIRRDGPELDIVLLKEDAYYRDQSHVPLAQRDKVNYDHPEAIEHELLLSQLAALQAGQAVECPVYDYAVHNRSGSTLTLQPAKVIVVEGILLFTVPELRRVFDMKFFMATALDLCLLRRMQRDLTERGRSLDSVVTQYESTVRPMYDEFIAPSAKYADLTIARGGQNRVALDLLNAKILDLLGSPRSQ